MTLHAVCDGFRKDEGSERPGATPTVKQSTRKYTHVWQPVFFPISLTFARSSFVSFRPGPRAGTLYVLMRAKLDADGYFDLAIAHGPGTVAVAGPGGTATVVVDSQAGAVQGLGDVTLRPIR